MNRRARISHLPWPRRGVAWLCLAVFGLRALLPTGFMPDLRALEAGQVEIVLCGAGGGFTVPVDEDGFPLPESGKSTSKATDCPFGLALSKYFLSGYAETPPPFHYAPAALIALPTGSWAILPSGPPLGSRAPPLLG